MILDGDGSYPTKRPITHFSDTLRSSNIAMENGPFEDVFPIKHGDIPLLC